VALVGLFHPPHTHTHRSGVNSVSFEVVRDAALPRHMLGQLFKDVVARLQQLRVAARQLGGLADLCDDEVAELVEAPFDGKLAGRARDADSAALLAQKIGYTFFQELGVVSSLPMPPPPPDEWSTMRRVIHRFFGQRVPLVSGVMSRAAFLVDEATFLGRFDCSPAELQGTIHVLIE
jgi:hypothetical protein